MAKPFGKPVHHGRTLTKGLRLTIAFWVAAIPAYFICGHATKAYPTLSPIGVWGPTFLFFTAFYTFALTRWFARRPTPRPPGSSRTWRIIGYVLLALFIAFPTGLISSLLYEPAFKLANGLGSRSTRSVEYAMVDKVDTKWFLDSPYWAHEFRWEVPDGSKLPQNLTPGSLAKITLRRGLLGARWIESIEYTALQ
jgi:hypothetical protein